VKANPDTDNARRHKSAKHPQEKITVPLLLSLIFLNSKPRLLTSYRGKKKRKTDVRAIIHFPPRAAITTRHQESVKPHKITQTHGNVKSVPPFINRKILNTKP
jgi:ABC-type dipeptide/oligopeptide/nickel transport system ATPase component